MNLDIKAILIAILAFCLFLSCRKNKRARRKAWNEKFSEQNKVKLSPDGERKRNRRAEIWNKTQMYIISLLPLFALMLVFSFIQFRTKQDTENLQTGQSSCYILMAVSGIQIILGVILMFRYEYQWKGTRNLPVQVHEVEKESHEWMAVLTDCIVPLVGINLKENSEIIELFLILIIVGIIFIRSDLYLGNPTWAILGYKVYKVHIGMGGQPEEKLVITKDMIRDGDYMEAIELDKNTWYARKN